MAYSVTLQTSDQVVSSGDVIGRVAYAASNESSGSDAILIAGAIESIAEGDFTAVANPASLVFSTSTSAAASEQMRLTSEGYLGINTSYPGYHLDVSGSGRVDLLNINDAFTFPTSDGLTNQMMMTDGSGILTFVSGVRSDTVGIAGSSGVNNIVYLSQADYDALGSYDDETLYYIPGSTGGGGGTLDGSGVANYIAFWSDTETLTYDENQLYWDSGNNRLGIGTATPSYTLDVNGTFSANSVNINDAFTFPTSDGSSGQVLQTDGAGNVTWETVSGGGGSVDGSGVANHIAFWSDLDTLTYDENQLYWDSTNNRLGIGTNSPNYAVIADVGSANDGIGVKGTNLPAMAVINSGVESGMSSPSQGVLNLVADAFDDIGLASSQIRFLVSTDHVATINGDGFGYGTAIPSGALHGAGHGHDLPQLMLTDLTTHNNLTIRGSGTAFTLDTDSTEFAISTGGTERVRVDSAGRLIVGATSSRSMGGFSPSLYEGLDANGSRLALVQDSNNQLGAGGLHIGKSRGTSIGDNTIVQSGDTLGYLYFHGADGTDMASVAGAITCEVDGTPGANDMPGRLFFSTSPDGTQVAAKRMVIDSIGNVGIGTSAPTYKFEVVDGSSKNGYSGSVSYVEHTGNGDPGYVLRRAGVNQWSIFDDFSDSDKFKINSGGFGGTTAITIDSSTNVGIGTSTPTAKLNVEGGVIFNDDGANADFRVEGDTDPNLLFVDASTDRVGIGLASAQEKLQIWNGGLNVNNGFVFYNSTGTTTGAGIGNGFNVTLNEQNGTTLSSSWHYIVRGTTTSTGTQTGALYMVYWDDASSTWNAKPVSIAGDTSNHVLMGISGSNLVIYTNNVTGYTISYTVEAWLVSDADGTPHSMGPYYMWERYIDDLSYQDGNVAVPSGNIAIGLDTAALAGADQGLHISATSFPEIKLTNSSTGETAADGSVIQLNSSDLIINNREDASLRLQTGGTDVIRIAGAGQNNTIGIGNTPASNVGVYQRRTISASAATHYSYFMNDIVESGAGVNDWYGLLYQPRTTAGTVLNSYSAIGATTPTLGAGSTIDKLYGYFVNDGFANGATTNSYGFYSTISSGIDGGKFALYMGSTAPSYFGGNIVYEPQQGGIGGTYSIIKPPNGFLNTASNQTGYLKIRLPKLLSTDSGFNNTMISFKVDIYEYSSGRAQTLILGGYMFSTGPNWLNVTAAAAGGNESIAQALKAEFGYDTNGHACVWISKGSSGSSSSWAYPQMSVRDVILGYANQTWKNYWDGKWEISVLGSAVPIDGTVTTTKDVDHAYTTNQTGYVFNEAGGNVDVRIEGDTDTHLFFTDASTDRIGISTSTPTATLGFDNSVGANTTDINERLNRVHFYNDGTQVFGIGVTAGSFNIGSSGTSADIKWWGNEYVAMQLDTDKSEVLFNSASGAIATFKNASRVLDFGNYTQAVAVGSLNNQQATNKIRLYNNGGYYAGFGVSTSSFNIYADDLIDTNIWGYGKRHFRLTNAAGYFNPTNDDLDFIVNGTSNNVLYVNAGTDTVVVGGTTARTGYKFTSYGFMSAEGTNAKIVAIDDTGASTVGTKIQSDTTKGYMGTETNHALRIRTNNLDRIDIDQNGNLVFNESGDNADFRIEGDTDNNLFFSDANVDRIGIGTGAPAAKLHVILNNTDESFKYCEYLDGNFSTTSSAANYTFGQYVDARKYVSSGVNDTGYQMGAEIVSVLDSSFATLTSTFGVRTFAGTQSSAVGSTVTNNTGLYGRVYNLGSGCTLTLAYGVRSSIDGDLGGKGSNITTAYGLFIDSISNATTKWGVYQQGANDNNYFAGNVAIGNSSAPANALTVDGGDMVFNDLGGDYDFRIESNTETHAFYLNGADGHIGIGTSTPSGVLHVSGPDTSSMRFDMLTGSGPYASGDIQTVSFKKVEDAVTIEHADNPAATGGSNTQETQNLIRMGTNFISMEHKYTSGLGVTYFPKFYVNTDTGECTINDEYTMPTSDGLTNQMMMTDGSGTLTFTSGVRSETTGITGASGINNIVYMSQTDYDNLSSYDNETLYYIV